MPLPLRLRISPITRKRLARLRQMKRAYWSLWILVVLYASSLGSALICNDRPLYLRYEGKSYFPAFRYYPQSTFIAGAPDTRCDYHALAARPEFAENEGNYMRWAPVPYGPNQVIEADRVEIPERVDLKLIPWVPSAEARIDRDYRVRVPGYGLGRLLGTESDADTLGMSLADAFRLPRAFRAAAEARFRGEAVPSADWTCLRQDGDATSVQLHLSTFATASDGPREIIKVTLREGVGAGARNLHLVFDGNQELVRDDGATWSAFGEETQGALKEGLAAAMKGPVSPFLVSTEEGTMFEARFDREVVRFPFRPVPGHLLGLDDTGRDVFARLLYGLRTSMTFGLILVVCSLFFGTLIGSLQGYFGGLTDLGGQRFTEVWGALPFLYIMILMGSVYGRGFALLIVCYAIFNWIGMSYYMRAEMLRLRKQPFVEAARCLGLPPRRIMFRHILPNALTPLITLFPFSLVGAIGSLATLDFLGFGLPPPTASWGEMLNQASEHRYAWWLILYPTLALFTVMLLGVFVGEGVRSAFDPRRHSRMQ
jgi:microcin C transport system permease protein